MCLLTSHSVIGVAVIVVSVIGVCFRVVVAEMDAVLLHAKYEEMCKQKETDAKEISDVMNQLSTIQVGIHRQPNEYSYIPLSSFFSQNRQVYSLCVFQLYIVVRLAIHVFIHVWANYSHFASLCFSNYICVSKRSVSS